jgi:8-oxo-dGTP pyrophosphatase MutT (NUDIX family)
VRGRDTGKWSFPKGHREGRESFLDCARRETFEETGVALDRYQPTACHKLAHGEYYFFDVPEEAPLNPSDTTEVMEARWMTVEEMRVEPVNVDVNYFLDRIRRSGRRSAQRPYHPS